MGITEPVRAARACQCAAGAYAPLVVRTEQVIAGVEPALAAERGVRWAYLFGSCARDAAGRDVDIALMPAAGAFPSAVDWGQLIARLEGVVGTKVDLVDLRAAPLSLLGAILGDRRRVLVDRERDARHEWEAHAMLRWIDFKPAYERYQRVRQEAMQERLRGAS